MSNSALLQIKGLNKSFGGVTATHDVNLGVVPQECHAIIGPNGAGKTTLISLLNGALKPDSGHIHFDNADITTMPVYRRSRAGLARSFQITSVLMDMPAIVNVMLGIQSLQGHSFRFWRSARRDARLVEPAMAHLELVGLADRADEPPSNFSHGEKRALEIAMALATNPKLLLLDEPMAGMGVEESRVMIKILQRLKADKTILLVEHDMDAVFALADRISVLVYGKIIASGTPEEIRADEAVRHAYLGDQ